MKKKYARIQLQGNVYVVFTGDGNNVDDVIDSFDRSTVGDEIAKLMAKTAREAYEKGYATSLEENCPITSQDS